MTVRYFQNSKLDGGQMLQKWWTDLLRRIRWMLRWIIYCLARCVSHLSWILNNHTITGWRLKTPFMVVELKRMKERCLHLQRRFSEVQATFLMSELTSMLFIQINTSAQANIKSSIKLNKVANPDRQLNLEGTLIHWVLPCPRSLITCTKEVISSQWIQLHTRIRFQRIGTQACIAISTRRQGTIQCIRLKHEIQDMIDLNVIT